MIKSPVILCAAALLATPIIAQATDQAPPAATLDLKRNKTLIDADGRVLGKIYEINAAKGVVTFMAQMKVYQLPVSTLSSEGTKIKTSLTRAQIGL
jgi:hypothetical protein